VRDAGRIVSKTQKNSTNSGKGEAGLRDRDQ
jgi:hypothetical protein